MGLSIISDFPLLGVGDSAVTGICLADMGFLATFPTEFGDTDVEPFYLEPASSQ